jgi:hypothetical protein
MSLENMIEFPIMNYCYISVNTNKYKIDFIKDTITKKKNPEKYYAVQDLKKNDDEQTDEEFIRKYMKDYEEIKNKLFKNKYSINQLKYSIFNINCALTYENHSHETHEEKDEFEIEHATKFSDYIKYINTTDTTTINTTTYDVNSFYSYCTSLVCSFATKPGTQKKITNDEFKTTNFFKHLAYYLIECDKKPFYLNDTVKAPVYWVTNYDICTYNLLKLDCKICDTYDYNVYIYDIKDCYEISKKSSKSLNDIFDLKKQKNSVAKSMVSSYFGTMFSKEKNEIQIKSYTKTDETDKHVGITVDNSGNIIKLIKNKKVKDSDVRQSKYNISRNQRFFYSYVNYTLIRKIQGIINNNIKIYRIYCDSIVCDKNDYLKLSDKMGDFKIENKKWNNKVGKFTNSHHFKETT